MSSIDKYVIAQAQKYNPNVRVAKVGNQLIGKINGQQIFSITDRYGYLSDGEDAIICNAIRKYEAAERERQRREQERLENERRAAGERLKSALRAAKSKLYSSYVEASERISNTKRNTGLKEMLDRMQAFAISSYNDRVTALEGDIDGCQTELKKEYDRIVSQIDALGAGENASTSTYMSRLEALKKINTNLVCVDLPISEIESLKAELGELEAELGKISEMENQLTALSGSNDIDALIKNAVYEIHKTEISSVENVQSILKKLEDRISEIKRIALNKKMNANHVVISTLNGILKACTRLREYSVTQNYQASNYRERIVVLANRAWDAYSSLDAADYTTCTRERIDEIYAIIREISMSDASDERTVKKLNDLLDEYSKYKRDDDLQRDNFRDYSAKKQELLDRGVSAIDIEEFDPRDYESQKNRMNKQLLQMDIQDAVSRTRMSMLRVCKLMEEKGFKLLRMDFGDEEQGQADALAAEAIFVLPGCEGVAWQIVSSDNGIRRRIVGIKRADGTATSKERVKEVAQRMESDGDALDFLEKYMKECGGKIDVRTAVDVDTVGSDQAILDNGTIELTAEGEKIFDEIVQSGDAAAKKKWSSKIKTTGQEIVNSCEHTREDERRRTEAGIKAAAAKKRK